MTNHIDILLVLLVVSIAAFFIVRRVWRAISAARNPSAGCVDCGCEPATKSKDWAG